MPDTHKQLIAKLAEELGPATAQHLVTRLVEAAAKPNQVEGVLLLLDELIEVSPKVARAAIESFPDLQQRDRLSDAVAWLDLGVALAESSGAIGMKFFKESPLVLGLIESPSVRSLVLKTALELAEQDTNVALEFLRVAPEVVSVISSDQLGAWLEIGFELTQAGAEGVVQPGEIVIVPRTIWQIHINRRWRLPCRVIILLMKRNREHVAGRCAAWMCIA